MSKCPHSFSTSHFEHSIVALGFLKLATMGPAGAAAKTYQHQHRFVL